MTRHEEEYVSTIEDEFPPILLDAQNTPVKEIHHAYRRTEPMVPSSSPGLHPIEPLSFSPPSSPPIMQLPSSPPSFDTRTFRRSNTSNNDPFSAAAKGDMNQHPQHSSKQDFHTMAEQSSDMVLGNMFDESSDELPTSDDHLEALPWSSASSSSDSEYARQGVPMGLGFDRDLAVDQAGLDTGLSSPTNSSQSPFREQGSPTAARKRRDDKLRRPDVLTPGRNASVMPFRIGSIQSASKSSPVAGRKRSAFSRSSSSVNDPFGAFGSAASPGHGQIQDQRPSHYHASTSLYSPHQQLQPASQRRRLIGSSPKMSRKGRFDRVLSLPTPADTQHDSANSEDDEVATPPIAARKTMAQVWHKTVEKVWDKGETTLDLSDRCITSIHPVIADLAKYVAIDPPRNINDSNTSTGSPTPTATRSRSRTSSKSHTLTQRNTLQLYLQNNSLTHLPSALFSLGANLRVLSLRSNKLKTLPSAIGTLVNLSELNIANNELEYLPAEIQNLSLEQFRWFPNPFVLPDAKQKLEITETDPVVATCLGPLQTTSSELNSLSTLKELCIRTLLTPVNPEEEDKTTLLQEYENGTLREMDADNTMDTSTISLLESARRCLEGKWGNTTFTTCTPSSELDSWCKGVSGQSRDDEAQQHMDVSSTLDTQGDNSLLNPYFNKCPLQTDRYYSVPVETRLQWTSRVAGVDVLTIDVASANQALARTSGVLPLLWKGCSKGCLDFLKDSSKDTSTSGQK
ncbi:unnamed protein product [Sympodiomycopsis kandeliae]